MRTLREELMDDLRGYKGIRVESVAVSRGEDWDGQEAWDVVLVLEAPSTDTWDESLLFDLKSRVIDDIERLKADNAELALPGMTYVSVVSDQEYVPDVDSEPDAKTVEGMGLSSDAESS